jgi:hypothetical protein
VPIQRSLPGKRVAALPQLDFEMFNKSPPATNNNNGLHSYPLTNLRSIFARAMVGIVRLDWIYVRRKLGKETKIHSLRTTAVRNVEQVK